MNLETFADQDSTNHDTSQQGFSGPPPRDQDPPSQSPTDSGEPDQGPAVLGLDEYLENGYDYKAPKRGDIIEGVILEVNDNGLIVDIGFKREGFVPAEDLTRLDEETRSSIKVGESFALFVLRPEDREGHPILSIHQARLYKDWIQAEQMMESGELYEGEVAGYNRGGLIVKFGKIRGFVPASQIVGLPRRLREEQRRKRMEAMIGEHLGLKIIEVDRQRRRLIFSQRRALRAWQELQRERVMAELVEGETRHGKVTSITNFGAFVDLGGADGLVHVSELSWSRVENPRQVLNVGDEIDVYVLDVDRERKRIALSLKKLQPDPWTIVDDHYEAGQLIEGRVTRVLDFGAFVELDLGIEGLLHASEMIGTPDLSPSDIVHSGEKLLVKIIRVDSRRKRLALSARQVRKDEWERWVAEQQAAREAEEEKAAREAEEEKAAREAEEEKAEAKLKASEVIEGEVVEEEAEAELETSKATEDEGVEEAASTPAPEVETEAVAATADMKASEASPLQVADASTTEEKIAAVEAERGETGQVGEDTPEAAFDGAATDEAEKIKEAEERAAETAEPDVVPVPEAAAEETTSVDPQVL
jgi:small subunit ribosomal protein S1